MIFCKTIRRYFTRIHHFGNNGGEAGTARESIVSYVCHAVSDSHGGKAATAGESSVSDGFHAVGDGHGGKAGTELEFANCFVSVVCALNSRKVAV